MRTQNELREFTTVMLVLGLFVAVFGWCFDARPDDGLRGRLERAQAMRGVGRVGAEHVDQAELSQAIALASRENPRLAALMLATAGAESGLMRRIAEGHCKPLECDHGRAVGLWQSHRLQQGATLTEQATEAARELTRATRECSGRAPFPLGAFRSYGSGKGCFGAVPRETERVELYKRILEAIK